MKRLLLSIKEALRSVFGSNYSGHRRTMRAFVVVLNLGYVITFDISTFVAAFIVPLACTALAIAIGYGMEKLDDSLDNNSYKPDDMRGNVHGAIEGGILSIVINIILVLI